MSSEPPAPSPLQTDVVIVGAGPVGLFAVFQCGMLGMRCRVLDALPEAGGQCAALYPEKPIYDIPALARIDGGDLARRMVGQAAPFEPGYHLGERAQRLVALEGGRWRVEAASGLAVEAAAVVIAAGGGAFGPNRPPLEGIGRFEGVSVHYHVRRQEDFRGRRVVIAGGGDSAVDWALALAEVAAGVALVHRRDRFRAAPESVARLRQLAEAGRVELVVPYQLAGVEGTEVLEAVVVETVRGESRRLAADTLLAFFGLATDPGPLASWELGLEGGRIPVDPATCETRLPGVYAIGDIAAYPGKLKLILCGFSEAAMAAHAMFARVRPGEALHFEYSTTKGVPG